MGTLRWLARTAIAALVALPVGAFVQSRVGWEIVSLEGAGAWAYLLWPVVLLALGVAAAVMVALPVSLLFRMLPRRAWTPPALVACEAIVGTALFLSVSFPISRRDTLLLLLPQLAFFGAYHALARRRGGEKGQRALAEGQRP